MKVIEKHISFRLFWFIVLKCLDSPILLCDDEWGGEGRNTKEWSG